MTKLDEKIVELLSDFDKSVQSASEGYSFNYFDSDSFTPHEFIKLFQQNGTNIVLDAEGLLKFTNKEIQHAIDSFQ